MAKVARPWATALPARMIVPVCVMLPRVRTFAPPAKDATLIAPEPLRSVLAAPIVVAPRSICVFVVSTMPAMLVPLAALVSKPPVKVLVSPASLPRVTVLVFRKVVSVVIVFAAPVMLRVYALAVVIKLFSVTLPVNAADTPLVMVRLLMLTDVPVMAPFVPALSPRLKAPPMPAPKAISSPAPAPVVMVTPLVNVTPVANAIPSLVLAMLPPMLLRAAPS